MAGKTIDVGHFWPPQTSQTGLGLKVTFTIFHAMFACSPLFTIYSAEILLMLQSSTPSTAPPPSAAAGGCSPGAAHPPAGAPAGGPAPGPSAAVRPWTPGRGARGPGPGGSLVSWDGKLGEGWRKQGLFTGSSEGNKPG